MMLFLNTERQCFTPEGILVALLAHGYQAGHFRWACWRSGIRKLLASKFTEPIGAYDVLLSAEAP